MSWYSAVADFAAKRVSPKPPPDLHDDAAYEGTFVPNAQADPFATVAIEPDYIADGHAPDASDERWSTRSAISDIYKAFDASQPVAQSEDLCGRDEELAHLLNGILYRRNHGIVSGTRGSGKTSLVRVFGQQADREGVVVLYAACDGDTTFGELMRDFLDQIPDSSIDPDEIDLYAQRLQTVGPDSSPHQITSLFARLVYSQVVIIVDEFDRVDDPVMQSKMASLLKLISDARLPIRLLIVGVNSTFALVVAEHPSLFRHITRLTTDPLSQSAVFDLIDRCASRCERRASQAAKELLANVSCGSPYHVRLFGTYAALHAAERNAAEIEREDVVAGLDEAFSEWATLNREDAAIFREIVDGQRGDSDSLVGLARTMAATQSDDAASGIRDGDETLLKGFGPAVQESDDGPDFRDATAPQFLVVFDLLADRRKPPVKRRERVGV